MDSLADGCRSNSLHVPDDDQIAFRQLQKVRMPELSPQQSLDLYAVWRDHYDARAAAKAAELPARLAELEAERGALFEQRAAMPPSERADVDARIAAIAQEIAQIVAPPEQHCVLDLIHDGLWSGPDG
jgi:hypothetical protein